MSREVPEIDFRIKAPDSFERYAPESGGVHTLSDGIWKIESPTVSISTPLNVDNISVSLESSSSIRAGGTLEYTGTRALIRATNVDQLFIRNIRIIGDGTNNFIDASSGLTPTSDAPIIVLDNATIENFADMGTISDLSGLSVDNSRFALFGAGLKVIDIGNASIITRLSAGNEVTSNSPYITFSGTHRYIDYSNLVGFNEPLAGESIVDFDPAIDIKRITIANIKFTGDSGGDFYRPGTTGNITGFAVFSGTETEVTSAAHGLSNGQTIFISEAEDITGGYTISDVTANTFVIQFIFVSDPGTGVWDTGSLTQTDPRVAAIHNGSSPDSQLIGSMSFVDNATETVIDTVGDWELIAGTTIAGPNIERFELTADNNLKALNLNSTGVTATGLVSVTSTTAAAKMVEISWFKNGAIVPGFRISAEVKNIAVPIPLKVPTTTIEDDEFGIYIRNLTNTTNLLTVNLFGGIGIG